MQNDNRPDENSKDPELQPDTPKSEPLVVCQFCLLETNGPESLGAGFRVRVGGYMRRLPDSPADAPKVVPVVPHYRCYPGECIHHDDPVTVSDDGMKVTVVWHPED